MTHGTEGKLYDRPSFTWVTPEEKARRDAFREELAFQRRSRQGELCAPMIVRDNVGGIRGVKSMLDGKQYDSKRALRATYRAAGMAEIGNDSSYCDPEKVARRRRPHEHMPTRPHDEVKAAIGRAISEVNLVSYRKDEFS